MSKPVEARRPGEGTDDRTFFLGWAAATASRTPKRCLSLALSGDSVKSLVADAWPRPDLTKLLDKRAVNGGFLAATCLSVFTRVNTELG